MSDTSRDDVLPPLRMSSLYRVKMTGVLETGLID